MLHRTCWLAVLLLGLACSVATAADPAPETTLFDGKTLAGWSGNTDWFRIEDGAVVGGKLTEKVPRNEFLTSAKEYGDFELTLKFKIVGEQTNAGIQVRSRRIPNHHEMIGYQADVGPGYTGALYDESRRKKVLAKPAPEVVAKTYKAGDWNTYRIRCEGPRVQLWINDQPTVDYSETDLTLEQRGLIGLQIHSGPPGEAWYKDIVLRELPTKTE